MWSPHATMMQPEAELPRPTASSSGLLVARNDPVRSSNPVPYAARLANPVPYDQSNRNEDQPQPQRQQPQQQGSVKDSILSGGARGAALVASAPFTLVGAAVTVAAAAAAAPVAGVAAASAGAISWRGDPRFHSGPCTLSCHRCDKLFTPFNKKSHCRTCKKCTCQKCRPRCCEDAGYRAAGF